MVKFKFTLTNILFWVGILSSIFLFENVNFFSISFGRYGQLPKDAFVLLFAIASISYLSMFILDFVFNKSRFSYIGFIIFGTFMAVSTVAIYKFDGMAFKTGAPDYFLTNEDHLRQTLTALCYILTLFAIFTVFINNHPSIKRLVYIYIIVLIVCYTLAIVSFIQEGDVYKAINSGNPGSLHICSLFYNSNMFAVLLLLGTVSAIGLNYFKKNIVSYISILFFLVLQIYVRSLTSILISLTITLVYFLIEIIFNFKKKPKFAMAELSIFVSAVVIVSTIIIVANKADCGGLSDFVHYLFNELFSTKYDTFSNRIYLWKLVIEIMKMGRTIFMFGVGPVNAEWVLGGMRYQFDSPTLNISSHSAYFQILLNFGVFGALLFILLLVVYFYSLVRLFKKNKRFCTLFLIMSIVYLALGVTESIIPFGMNAQGFIVGMFVFLPVICKYRHYKRPFISEDVMRSEVPTLLDSKLMVRKTARFILALASAVAIYFIFPENLEIEANKNLLMNILVMLGFAFISIPYLSGLWAKNSSVNAYLVRTLLNVLIVALIAGGATYLYIEFGKEYSKNLRWVIPAIILFALLLEVVIYSAAKGGSFKLYLNTFISFKTCLASLLITGGFFVVLYFYKETFYLSFTSMYTMIGLPILTILLFYVSSLVIPFKDTRSIITYVNSYDLNLLKREVVRERLRDGI